MFGARSLAMALNRLIDAGIDARNPRTAGREIPSGALTIGAVVGFCVVSLVVFLFAVWQLDPVVRYLWPIPVAAFVIYPYLKRFTWLCHVWLGLVDGLAPVGRLGRRHGHAALGGVGARPGGRVLGDRLRRLLLALRCRDRPRAGAALVGDALRRDRRLRRRAGAAPRDGRAAGPRRLGLDVGWPYWLGVVAVGGLLAYEHSLIRPGNLRRLDAAFFTMNGVISVAFFAFVLADVV